MLLLTALVDALFEPAVSRAPEGRPPASFPSRVSARDVLDGLPPAPTSVAEAYECLATVSARLRRHGDPRAVFPDVYAVITRRVRDAVEGTAPSPFIEPQFISRLAGRFCELYLAALRRSLDGARDPSAAWARADLATKSPHVLPVQHALLGLNAHINYDLALGLHGTLSLAGDAADAARMRRYRHDHDAVNGILEAAMPEVLELLAGRHGCPAARLALRNDHLRRRMSDATLLVLKVWRDRVWDDLVALLAAKDAARYARIVTRMDRRSGLVARLVGGRPGRISLPRSGARFARSGNGASASGSNGA